VRRDQEGEEELVVLVNVPAEYAREPTLCPRLEIGNSSENPCRRPSTIPWK
jgi:hypothetical protein